MTKRILCLLGIAGTAVIAVTTVGGAGLSPDSMKYISITRNVLDGYGLYVIRPGREVPLAHWPPGLPAVMALMGWTGIDPLEAGRILNAAMFGINIFLAGLIVFKITRSRWVSILAGGIMLTSLNMIRVHGMIWSEPLFTCLMLGAILCLAHYTDTKKSRWLAATVVLAAGAVMVRYHGIGLAAGLAASIAWAGVRGRRVRDAAVLMVVVGLVLGGWLVRTHLVATSLADRSIGWHPPTMMHLRGLLDTLCGWWIPETWRPYGSTGLVVLIMGLLAGVAAADKDIRRNGLVRIVSVQALCFMASLVAALTWFDAAIPMNERTLAPMFPLVLIVVSCGIGTTAGVLKGVRRAGTGAESRAGHARSRWLSMTGDGIIRDLVKLARGAGGPAFGLLIVAFLFLTALEDASWIRESYGRGRAHYRLYARLGTGYKWMRYGLVDHLKRLPAGTVIISNAPGAVYVMTGRKAVTAPRMLEYDCRTENPNYQSELSQAKTLIEKGAVLAYFTAEESLRFYPQKQELSSRLRAALLAEYDDGAVYGSPHRQEGSTAILE